MGSLAGSAVQSDALHNTSAMAPSLAASDKKLSSYGQPPWAGTTCDTPVSEAGDGGFMPPPGGGIKPPSTITGPAPGTHCKPTVPEVTAQSAGCRKPIGMNWIFPPFPPPVM